MKGDFSRITFDKTNHFRRVLTQQGRVTLDADSNEQVAIFLHYIETLANDLIGPYGAPEGIDGGFSLTVDPEKKGGFFISKGRYYVDGILVENETNCLYTEQKHYIPSQDDQLQQALDGGKKETLWVYLDVCERHITSIDNDAIREKALGGPDTCTRTEVVWQVKALSLSKIIDDLKKQRKKSNSAEPEYVASQSQDAIVELEKYHDGKPANQMSCTAPLTLLPTVSNVSLSVRITPESENGDNCLTSPDSKYRGLENHLYRVEIHRGGPAGIATFMWSRDNGNVVTRRLGADGDGFMVSNPQGFEAGNWVELIDDSRESQGNPGTLVKLAKVEGNTLTIDPASVPRNLEGAINPKIRCWNQTEHGDIALIEGAVPVKEKSDNDSAWIDLEDGIQIQFSSSEGEYRTGDYWLIPARAASGRIEWPMEQNKVGAYKSVRPHGVEHHYAPLGFLNWDSDGSLSISNCRCTFSPISVLLENK